MTYPKRVNFFKKLFKRRSNLVKTDSTGEMNLEQHILLDYYISFIQNHPDLILMFALDGEIVSHNKRSINTLLGYRPRQKIPFEKLISKDHYARLTEAFNDAKYGESKRVHFDIFNKQNEQLHMVGTFIPIGMPSKQTEAVSLILKDITATKKLERNNISKKNHLEQAQNIAKIGSWEYHLMSGHMNCSQSCYEIAGLNRTTLLSKDTIFSLIHPEDRDQLIHLIKASIAKGTSFSTEIRMNRFKTNEERFIKVKANVQLEANIPIKLIGVIKDITEQRKLEMTLRVTNRRYRYIFDHLHAGIWMWDEGDETLTFASKGLSELLQIPLKTLYNKANFWDDLILPEHRPAFEEKQHLLNKGEYVERQYRIKAGDGVVKWIHEQTIPRVDETGKITHLFGMVTDISYGIEMQKS